MRSRCHALLRAAESHLHGVATWAVPQAGMFLWVELLSTEYDPQLLYEAMKRIGVAVIPGDQCAVAPPPAGRRHLRLSYVLDEGEYDEGLRKVGRLVADIEQLAQ